MPLVRSALGHHVDHAASAAAILGFKVRGNAEFGDGLHGKNRCGSAENTGFINGGIVAVAVVHIGAIEEKVVGATACAIDGKDSVGAGRIGDLVRGAAYTGNEEDELLVVATVHREIGDDFGFDDAAE